MAAFTGIFGEEYLEMDDLVSGLTHCTDFPSMEKLLGKKGFDYESEMIVNSTNKMHNFFSATDSELTSAEGSSVRARDNIVIRIENGNILKKITLMTASNKYYESLICGMEAQKFEAGQSDKIKQAVYTSPLFPGVEINLSVVQAVKEGHPYNRHQLSITYANGS